MTDVFTGNGALKKGEGLIRLIFDALKWGFSSSRRGKLKYLIAKLIFESLKCQLDLRKSNGAYWLGLNGMAVKSHGGTDPLEFANKLLVFAIGTIHNQSRKSSDSR